MNEITNDQIYGVKGVHSLYQDRENKGVATVSRYKYEDKANPMSNLRAMRDGGAMFHVRDGEYVRLHIQGEGLVMSDTGMERISNREFIKHANGRVLIGGLGIGMVLHNIIDKLEVTEIIVIEKYQDVIDLVWPKFKNDKLKVICADIHEWKPVKGEKFDTIYFDIWTDISEDNLVDISKFHNIFKHYLNRNNPNCWMDSWMKQFLQKRKRQESRYSY